MSTTEINHAQQTTDQLPLSEHREVTLSQGTIRYREAGAGPPFVFVHGYLLDGRLWDGVAKRLAAAGARCIVPDWPMGAHTKAMNPDADMSPYGMARNYADFLEALDLTDVTMVANDSGGAMTQVFVTRHPERVSRLVFTNCDTHENFPPGPFKLMPPIAKLPGGMSLLSAPFRIGAVARLAMKPFAAEPIDRALISSWLRPAITDAAVRHDTAKLTAGMHKRYTLEAAPKLREFDGPVLLTWGDKDRVFTMKHARRFAAEFRNAKIVEIEGAKTFVALDRPAELATAISDFCEL